MKIISSSKSELSTIVEKELRGNEPAIVVLPEGSWDGHESIPKDIVTTTEDYRLSIIGTKGSKRGFEVVYLVSKGSVVPLGIYLTDGKLPNDGVRRLAVGLNRVYNISPTIDVISAIIKQCSEIYGNPINENTTVDLICLPSAIDHTQYTKNLLVAVNKHNISDSTLLVHAVLGDTKGTDIFQLPNFVRLGQKPNGYAVYQYSR